MGKLKRLGFTLIELLAVIVILAIILAIAVPSISSAIKSASKSAFSSDAKMVLNAIRYKRMENENFDVTSINVDNIDTILGLSNANYSSVGITIEDNNTIITLIGTNKWKGLVACGTYRNMKVVESASDCGTDNIAPTITLLGDNPTNINVGEAYADAGVEAIDNIDGNITDNVIVTSNINPNVPGTYIIKYMVTDVAGNQSVATRTVNIIDNVAPIINLDPNGNEVLGKVASVKINITDMGGINNDSLKYVWTTSNIEPTSDLFTSSFNNNQDIATPSNVSGMYYLWIMASDVAGNNAIIMSNVFNLDNTAPVITMNGSTPYGIEVGGTYIDAGATAIDDIDGSVAVVATGTVNPSVIGTYTITYTATDNAGNVATVSRIVKVVAPLNGDSIIAAIKNTNYPSGNYTMTANDITYNVELITINGDTTYSLADGATVSLGDNTADQRMLVVKYNGNLTIDSGVTLTATTRKKGMFIYTSGTLTNNGTISMTARGANATGQNVYLWKNVDGSYEYIRAVGALGAASTSSPSNAQRVAGKQGIDGSDRATGGGGSGGAYNNISGTSVSGAGGAGTSYSGGSGGGATASREVGTYTGYAGSGTGGAGGAGRSTKYSDSNGYNVGGGAGNPGGVGSGTACCTHATGENGTGGLLIIYVDSLINNSTISSNGSLGGYGIGASGGSSGGGSINLFVNDTYTNAGTIAALGGAAQYYGGSGGDGTVTTGYIYHNDYVPLNPKVVFSETSSTAYKNDYNIKVTVTSVIFGLKSDSLKYVWTTSSAAPAASEFVNSFASGDTISVPSGISESYYLWVTATDNNNNVTVENAGPFNIDNISPVITIAGSNPVTLYTGVDTIYADAGATATDNRDGTLSVTTTSNVNPSIPGTYTVTYTATDSAGNTTTSTRTVEVVASITGDSVLNAIKNTNAADGYYKLAANGVGYDIELITVNGDTTYSATTGSIVSLGDTTADKKMLVVKYNGNLTIDAGVTVTPAVRKKGMLIYVAGTLTNNGTISMTARGAIATGQNVYLWKNSDGSYEYVPAAGGTGAVSITGEVDGKPGTDGAGRGTGGGGGGSSMRGASRGGNGAAGTSYSGGSGGGGASSAADSGVTAGSAAANGGAGGVAVGRRTSGTMYVSSGGAGNPSGNDARPTAGANITVTGNAASSAEQGTGGLLIVYGDTLNNNGTIEARGSASKYPAGYNTSVAASGGSSGGGSVNIFYKSLGSVGTTTAQGGQSGPSGRNGGNGGDGTITSGYIYNNSYVPLNPIISFSATTNTTYKQTHSVVATATSTKIGIASGGTKYVWTTSSTAPAASEIVNDFTNGTVINSPDNVYGAYYLWILATDNNGISSISGVGPFNVDSMAPVITINGLNPYASGKDLVYSDAGATAVDSRDGTVTVTTTSNVNPSIVGTYTVTYTATDSLGNTATATRTVNVDYTYIYNYIGAYQTFTAPFTGNYEVELWGAQGGSTVYNNNNTGAIIPGGLGGYTKGTISLNANDILYVYVGGKGQNGSPSLRSQGGYNGGGAGGTAYQGGGAGGGATDIRLVKERQKYRYIRDYVNGSSVNTGDHWVEIQAIDINGNNVALGKPVTCSGPGNATYPISRVTDGSTATASYADAGATGLQYVEIDLGAEYELSAIKVWHYYSDSRAYNATQTVLLDETKTIQTDVFNSATYGVYTETSAGRSSILDGTIDLGSLRSRIMIAAGGSGTSNWTNGTTGGYAGGLTGQNGILNSGAASHTLATAGTQTSAGTGASNGYAGFFGRGGNSNSAHGSGGGGGYYGGGGGGYVSGGVSAGAGGSSFISGYTGCDAVDVTGVNTGSPNHYSGKIFIDTVMINGASTMPTVSDLTEVGHSGNGYARITYLSQ